MLSVVVATILGDALLRAKKERGQATLPDCISFIVDAESKVAAKCRNI